MMSIYLLERLQLLLNLAKNPKNYLTAHENIAAAKEIIDTAFHLDAIDQEEYRSYRSLCTSADLIVSNAEIERARATLPRTYTSFSDGVRAVQVMK